MKGFRYHQNKFLRTFATTKTTLQNIPAGVQRELHVWTRCIQEAQGGLPIPQLALNPPLYTISFMSDAAGARTINIKGKQVNISKPEDRGAASIGFTKDGYIFFLSVIKWPMIFLDKYTSHSAVF